MTTTTQVGPAGAIGPTPADPEAAGGAPPGTGRSSYLAQLRRLLEEANRVRKPWISQVGLLLHEAQTNGSPTAILSALAGQAGYQGFSHFSELRAQLASIDPPSVADPCHIAVLSWLDKLLAASDTLREIERTQDIERLREVQGLIAEARHEARRFTAEIGELMRAMRRRSDARRAVHRTRVLRARERAARPARPLPIVAEATSIWTRVARLFGFGSPGALGRAGS